MRPFPLNATGTALSWQPKSLLLRACWTAFGTGRAMLGRPLRQPTVAAPESYARNATLLLGHTVQFP